VSYRHVQQLERVGDEFAAVLAATTYMGRTWNQLGSIPETRLVRFSHIRAAVDNLEVTYSIRLFSEFEALLHDHLSQGHPRLRIPRTTEALINRVALREHIPDPIRRAAQQVREYRNLIVHRRPTPTPALDFRQVLAALNRFLVRLPDPP
jgi:hypothetical protein